MVKRPDELGGRSEKRVKGIEPSCPAWEAGVLPLNYTRDSNAIQTLSTVASQCVSCLATRSFAGRITLLVSSLGGPLSTPGPIIPKC